MSADGPALPEGTVTVLFTDLVGSTQLNQRLGDSAATALEREVETCVLESADQAPMRWGFWRAYSLTALGARRSELPSRSTGFTALPFSLS